MHESEQEFHKQAASEISGERDKLFMPCSMKGSKVQTLSVYTINLAVHSYSAYIPLHSYRSVEEWKS